MTVHVESSSILEMMGPSAVGPAGEKLAAQHLQRRGYRIPGRNLRRRDGEIDLLAEAPGRHTIVVVEVKASQLQVLDGNGRVLPGMRVDRRKQRKLVGPACRVAGAYRLTNRPPRFDVVVLIYRKMVVSSRFDIILQRLNRMYDIFAAGLSGQPPPGAMIWVAG